MNYQKPQTLRMLHNQSGIRDLHWIAITKIKAQNSILIHMKIQNLLIT